MHLKVGELARSSGLTVRTLHHYDEIGLLKPSGRSESGYRLYSDVDVARLHGIQALRHLGLALHDIAALLDGEAPAPEVILEEQMRALDRQIEQASELRGRLAMIREGIVTGAEPAIGDWLQALSLMATYGKYFSTQELMKIFADWRKIETEWPALLKEVQALMDAGSEPASPPAQKLARRWMALVLHWMGGDFELIHRWGEMYKREPVAHGRKGGPSTEMFVFMQKAIDLRKVMLDRHFEMSDLRKIRYVPEGEWQAVADAGAQLVRERKHPLAPEAQALAARWLGLVDRLVGGDVALRGKMIELQRSEPLFQASSVLTPEVRDLLLDALKGLDPHAT